MRRPFRLRPLLLAAGLFLALVLASVGAARNLGTFLSFSRVAAQADLLVVEDWLPPYVLREAVAEFNRNGYYKKIVLLGARKEAIDPLDPPCLYSFPETLVALGIRGGSRSIEYLLRDQVEVDRTFHSAQALQRYLRQGNFPSAIGINVVTVGAHGRRSWLLYHDALGDRALGVIAIPDRRFDASDWWRSSEGARAIIGEAIAYFYVRIAFLPWR